MWAKTLSDYMRKVVILAAGRGTRMRDAAGDLPKPMILVAGKPILEHILDRLRAASFTDVLIVTGYRAGLIEAHFASYPMRIEFRRQQQLDGTARAALLARDFAVGDPFLLTFGDILTETRDYQGMWSRLEEDARAVVVVKHVEDPWQGAAVYEQNGILTRIIEKPPPGASTTNWNSAGSYVFRPNVFPELQRVPMSARGEYELTSALQQMIHAGQKLLLYPLLGTWRDVGRPEDLAAAEELLDASIRSSTGAASPTAGSPPEN
jgi:UDP-N-acetylglucosamine diphosphorylase / glucose-1-phosphate thymidylyltransferase / UDP-N-acetylgalactosamine diphosphorylase / glucosamine-1-phosphate N-acetyltransferase / galactosamine-1-phosphate N-acetyltransferase